MAPVYLESAHAYASHTGRWQPCVPLERSRVAHPYLPFMQKGWHCFGRAPTWSEGCLSLASYPSIFYQRPTNGAAPDALRLPHRPSQSWLSPSWSPRSLPPNFSPRDSWTLSKKPRRMRRLLASTPAFAKKTVNLRHVAINKQPIAPRPLLLTRGRLPAL